MENCKHNHSTANSIMYFIWKIRENKQIQYHGYGTRTAQQHVAKHAKQTSLHTEDERKHLIHN